MFDPVTAELIAGAPPLDALDLEELPRRFTNAYAEIVAARVRMRGAINSASRTEELARLIDQMRRLAAAQEAFVATDPGRDSRSAAAFVAGTAHQLCLMAEIADVVPAGEDAPTVLGEDENDEDNLAGEADDATMPDELEDGDDPNVAMWASGPRQRATYIDAVRAAPEICATLLFLIADAQPDAAEMAKRIRAPEGMTGEAQLIQSIADLAAGRLANLITTADPVYDPPSETSPGGFAVDALVRRLHAGVRALASEILAPPPEAGSISKAQTIFREVKDLALMRLDEVFAADGPVPVSVFPGPLHLANLLLGVSGTLVDFAVTRIRAPAGVNEDAWWRIVRGAARKRPYLWRNHRDAIAQGYLTPGVSAAVSFPTGGGKSTLAELKIATALLQNKKVVVLAPTLALVDQTAFALRNAFYDYEVLGDLDDDGVFAGASSLPEIIVTTPERCLMLLSSQAEALADIGLIVFDECHLIHPRDADRSRRGVDAMLCILNLTRIAPEADLLMISAMMKNAQELAGWLKELTGRDTLHLDLAWKPTRQARGCVTYKASRIRELDDYLRKARSKGKSKGAPKAVRSQLTATPYAFFCLRQTWATLDRRDYALMQLLDADVEFNTGIARNGEWYLTPNGNAVAARIASAAAGDSLKTLVFVQSTVIAEGAVKTFRTLLPDRRTAMNEAETAMYKRIVEEMGGPQYCYLLVDGDGLVVGGATSHHAQLLKDERDLHKSLFERRDGLDALFATSTVAQGMNLPSDIVLIAGDSRWDDTTDGMRQLEAHELLNAAGRAGRAGESGQGFVLIVPSRVIDFDDKSGVIDSHWHSLQGIFSQSDQCLTIDDPLTDLLDHIHDGVGIGTNENYLLARLPAGSPEEPDGPARTMLARSFAAYRKRSQSQSAWIDSRIDAALALRAEQAVDEEESWVAQVASATGISTGILNSLADLIDEGKFGGDTLTCMDVLFVWLEKNPEFVLQLLRPNDIEGLFGKAYKDLDGQTAKARHALPVLRALTDKWMTGKPLCDLELAAGTPVNSLKTCETARHFVVRVVSDVAFVAGLPGRIFAARQASGSTDPVPTVVATLADTVRRGCHSPDALANAMHLRQAVSRVAARVEFIRIRQHIKKGTDDEPFDATLDRIRSAHTLATLTSLFGSADAGKDADDSEGADGGDAVGRIEEHECGRCNGAGRLAQVDPFSGENMRCPSCESEGVISYWVTR